MVEGSGAGVLEPALELLCESAACPALYGFMRESCLHDVIK